MKRFIIGVLICVNLALVTVLAFHATAKPAQAQRRGRGLGDFTTATARRGANEDVLYIIDNNSGVLFGIWANTTRRETVYVPLGPRDLNRDFPTSGR